MNIKKFTQNEINTLHKNPYTAAVNESTIKFTLEFKLFVVDELKLGTVSTKIFKKAGYDIDILGKVRVYSTIKRIKRQLSSPNGLKEATGNTKQKKAELFAKEQLAAQKTSTAINTLQNQVIQLQAEMDFLKDLMAMRVAEDRRKT